MNGDIVKLSSERHRFDKIAVQSGTVKRNDARCGEMVTTVLIGSRRTRRRMVIKLSPYLIYVGIVGLSLGTVAALTVFSLLV